MHDWSEENVDWNGIEKASWYIGCNISRWGRIPVHQIKEKFGTVRVYCSFGVDSFYGLIWPRRMCIPRWWPWKLDLTVFNWVSPLLNRLMIPYQKWIYRRVYKKAVQKWPHLYDEIVSCADWGELFEGYLPGYKHNNYWEEVK